MQVLASLAKAYRLRPRPRRGTICPDEVKLIILHGTGGMPVALTFKDGRKELHRQQGRSRA